MTPPEQAAPPDTDREPSLPADAALVALVPATGDLDGAAAAAWEYARRLANAGRRVALIDCYVDEPRLHAVAGESNEDGIVDVFEYGASLSRIARAQPEGSLFFVPAGTFSPDPARMMARPRWRRLSAGFRHEHAVMLLFLPPDCLGVLASGVDGLVALAPGHPDADLAAAPEIRAALERGTPLLATWAGAAEAAHLPALGPSPDTTPASHAAPAATSRAEAVSPPESAAAVEPAPEGETPDNARAAEPRADVSTEAPTAPAASRPPEPHVPGRPILRRPLGAGASRRRRVGAYALVLVLAAAAAVVNFRRQLGWGESADAGPEEPSAPVTPAFRSLAPHAVDTLPFAVQLSAWTSFSQALEDADTARGRGFLPMVAPLEVRGTSWYRVYVGPVASEDAADSLLAAVRAAGLDGSGTAGVALVPLSFALRRVATQGAARAELDRLRSAGVAAFVLGQADGSYRLFAGAFNRPDRAALLDSLLTSTGSAGSLGPRVGFRP